MHNHWFRLYAEFATDPKVQMLSEADQRRYIMLLCLRCSNGDVTLHETEVAFQLRISNEEWAATKRVLMAKGLIDKDNKPTAWNKRQYVSDSSAARVAKHRQEVKRRCNVTVTPPDTDTDTDTDTEERKERTTVVVPKKAPAKIRRQIPADFDLTAESILFHEQRLPFGNLAETLQHFRDYHAGKGTVMLDWQAAWRTWVSNQVKFSQRQPVTGGRNATGYRKSRNEEAAEEAIRQFNERNGISTGEYIDGEYKHAH
jgi:hypothetical protein